MSIVTAPFHWTEAYSVNIGDLDRQHQKLLAILRDFNKALSTGGGNAVTYGVLVELADYARIYFAAEEALMARQGFIGLVSHRMEHDDFKKKVARFKRDFTNQKSDVPVSLLLFLQSWLKEHVLVADKESSAYLKTRGVT